MWDKLEALDEFLLSRVFEKLAHWSQRMFGFHCFNWARVSAVGAFLSGIAFIAVGCLTLTLIPGPYVLRGGLLICYILMLIPIGLSGMNRLLMVKLLEIIFFSQVIHRPTANILRIRNRRGRVQNLFFTALMPALMAATGTLSPFLVAWLLLYAAYDYFVACTPLPPGTSKVREWINALKSFRIQVPVPVPSQG